MVTDDELVHGFETGTLTDFPHAQHVRLTIIYLDRHGREDTLNRLADGLLLFATTKGHPEKFHVTMTRAWVELIVAARAACPGARDAASLVAACPLLLDRDGLLRFYSADRLNSDLARAQWVTPDLPVSIGDVRGPSITSGPEGHEPAGEI
ncbi:MAG: hypothetical protein ABI818_17960 [Acidobacteriota bacterium]